MFGTPKHFGGLRALEHRKRRLASVMLLLILTSCLFSLTVAAQDTYIITDGDDVIVHTTYRSDPEEVLEEAGVELGSTDTFTSQRNGDHFDLTIWRRQFIRVFADGGMHYLHINRQPVAQVLQSLGIALGELDRVSVPLSAESKDGMVIRVTRIEKETITYTATVPAQERVFLTTALQPGQETVLDAGSDGVSTFTAEVTYKDGEEIAQKVLSETVVTPSRDRVVIRGDSAASMPTDAEGNTIVTAGGEVLEYSKVIDGKATAYNCPGYVGHTASGTVAEVGKVAVDPKVIPLGSRLYVVSQDGQYVYGYCIAEDTGGLIKGNKVDLYFSTWDECIQFGYRPVTIYVVS